MPRRARLPLAARWLPLLCLAAGVGLPPSGVRAAPLPPPAEQDRALALLRDAPCELVSETPLASGVTGARRVELLCPDGTRITAKWRPAPDDLDGWNNSPRKELAAWALQDMVLEPEQRVVPPIALRCVSLETARDVNPGSRAIPDGTQCVLGTLQLWLEEVHVPERLLEPQRFVRDRVYARHLADLNLFTYLIEHRDGRNGNFMVSDQAGGRRVFSVDNGIAFGGWIWNYFVPNWDRMRVPALRRETVERLRGLGAAELSRLAVVSELHMDASGVLRPGGPTAPGAPDEGVFYDGQRLQLGLSRDEIAGIQRRRARLLQRVDRGEIPLF